MGLLLVIFDVMAVVGICAVAYVLYRKFVAPGPRKDDVRKIAYEEGFADAVRYFGLRKLYQDDEFLRQRMEQVFAEAGVPHTFAEILEQVDRPGNKDKVHKLSERKRT